MVLLSLTNAQTLQLPGAKSEDHRLNSLLFGCAVCSSDKPLFCAVPKGAEIKLIMLGNITDEP